jgi:hypothetical protein
MPKTTSFRRVEELYLRLLKKTPGVLSHDTAVFYISNRFTPLEKKAFGLVLRELIIDIAKSYGEANPITVNTGTGDSFDFPSVLCLRSGAVKTCDSTRENLEEFQQLIQERKIQRIAEMVEEENVINKLLAKCRNGRTKITGKQRIDNDNAH